MANRVQVRGHPRSGTSIMARVLRIPREICITHEVGLYQFPAGITIPDYIDGVKSGLAHGYPNNKDIYDLDEMCQWLDTLKDTSSVEVIRKIEQKLFTTKRYGDKVPLEMVSGDAGDFRLIYMLRDGRNVVASRVRAMQIVENRRPGWATLDVRQASREWVETLDRWKDWIANNENTPVLQMKLEELVEQQEESASKLSNFLDISYIDLLDSIREKVTFNNSNNYAWRKELSDWEQEFSVEAIEKLKELRYI